MSSQYSNGHRIVECCEFCVARRKRDNLPTDNMAALEVFAGDGVSEMRHLPRYYAKVRGFENDPTKMEKFKKNVDYANYPLYDYRIGDAFNLIQDPSLGKVQHVFIDHVVGIYGDKQQYCEYFEMLPLAVPVVDPEGGCITINVTDRPYDCKEGSDWYNRRKKYYNCIDPTYLHASNIEPFHRRQIERCGYVVDDYQVVPRLEREHGDRMSYKYWTFYIKGGDSI